MSQGATEGNGEPEAKALHTKRLYRAVVETVHKLDVIISNKTYREVFRPENISLRNKLRELCVKLMFLHPVDYGRKAEELLWRKVYYEVIQLIKTNKKHIHSRSALECAYRTHLIAGVGFYQHLLLYIQSHYQLELQGCIDWTHVTDPLIGHKKPMTASGKELEWAEMACHRCLVYLGDLARYQNELAGVDTEHLAERLYHQAVLVAPNVGMPYNQLGTLAGSRYYNVEATYFYLRCIQSEVPFEGAYGNLKRLYEKAAKMYRQLRKSETRKLSPSRKRAKDIKRLLVSFMYLQSLLQSKSSSMDSELTSLCQSELEDFNLCLFYLPSGATSSPANEEEEEYENGYTFLPDVLVFRMVAICLMSVHSLKRTGTKQYSTAIAFTLALFSHLVNHVNIRLQAVLEEGENPVPSFRKDNQDELEMKEPSIAVEPEPALETEIETRTLQVQNKQNQNKSSKKFLRLSHLRRRRRPQKADESDLSEGFDSDSSEELAKDSENSEGGSEKSDEEAETAFDVESESEMNSQESRSDLEEIEDDHNELNKLHISKLADESIQESGKVANCRLNGVCKADSSECIVNGPGTLGTNEPNMASNLQAMSSQMFQTKRCFRLAPTFSNILQMPSSDPCPSDPVEVKPFVNGDVTEPSTAEYDAVSESECSIASSRSSRNEKSLQEKLDILSSEGLLPTVKVFLDWLRTNPDIIIMCAQSSQSLWNRLSVLLNILPSGTALLEAGIPLCSELKQLVMSCEQPDLGRNLVLLEDITLRNLPALKNAHRTLHFEHTRLYLSALEETIARICCIRSFGHFLTQLQGSVLQFNAELGIFISSNQAEQENVLQQAEAQFRMAREEARRNRLMRDMAQLRLQLEVSQLEGSLQQPKTQSVMSPYLVPDTQAFCQHLQIVRQLASSGRFIIIIPRTVIDGLDFLKKENSGARDGIRYLEAEFRKGNRYIRCQKDGGKSFERHKLKRQDIDAWHLYKIFDSCKQLTLSQGGGEEDTTGMVTVLTGLVIQERETLSTHVQSALQAINSANIEIKNILEFYKQWKEMG
ncbi:protein SMG5 [Protopterus annectens]|uniref:protein SMG5 n=1 Tax=Protopterus annectens TaxID=7888 RepID=UPI001CFA043F|nr:protein SMG5 [Protopterus annectens]